MIKEKRNLVKLLLFLPALIFFLVGILTLSDYGINWDEPIHFIRGQAYWRYLTTGKHNYQDLPVLKIHYPKNDRVKTPPKFALEDDRFFRRSLYQDEMWNFDRWLIKDGGHPPLSDILAAASNWLFYQKLGILGDIESYHLFIVFVSAILVLVVGFFAAETYGIFAGIIACLSLILFPLFFGESHFNIKDPPETAFFALTIWTFWRAIKKQSARWMIASAVFAGMALGTKFNILFLPLIVLPWLIARGIKKSLSKKIIVSLLFFPTITLAIFFLSWPYLWQDPANILKIFHYYQTLGLNQFFQSSNFYFFGFNLYPPLAILFTTPLTILFFTIIGIFGGLIWFKKDKDKTILLWLLWLLVPIIRVTIPGTSIYGGIRQVMEFIPAMALLSGLGAKLILDKIKSSQLVAPAILLLFLPLGFKIAVMHPNQSLYFNSLIGGLSEAAQRDFPHWGLSLGNEYRQGLKWLNQNAEKETNLTLFSGHLPNLPRIWIREDINFGDHYFSDSQKQGEYIMALIYEGWDKVNSSRADYLKKISPIYQIKVEEVPILKIWKNE